MYPVCLRRTLRSVQADLRSSAEGGTTLKGVSTVCVQSLGNESAWGLPHTRAWPLPGPRRRAPLHARLRRARCRYAATRMRHSSLAHNERSASAVNRLEVVVSSRFVAYSRSRLLVGRVLTIGAVTG